MPALNDQEYLDTSFSHFLPPFNAIHHSPPLPPPPQVAHKVWIVDCKSCGTFLTNRGMKAVLLLRPNVPLFSTDALPINCSAYTSNPDALRGGPSSPACHQHQQRRQNHRTCECLTQTLCCHGCGSAVGYMIVIPCARCTSSLTTSNRATNGHRFVFHSSEIVVCERKYIQDEPGVLPYELPPHSTLALEAHTSSSSTSAIRRSLPASTGRTLPRTREGEYLLTPPLESAEPAHVRFGQSVLNSDDVDVDSDYPFRRRSGEVERESTLGQAPLSPPLSPTSAAVSRNRLTSPTMVPSQPLSPSRNHILNHYYQLSTTLYEPSLGRGMPGDSIDASVAVRWLKSGEVLLWTQLRRSGEIPGVCDDERARVGGRDAC